MELVSVGITMGFLLAAPPGAVTAETLRRGLGNGFGAAMGVQLGSIIGDCVYAFLAIAGLAALAQSPASQIALGSIGSLLLVFLAWSSLRNAFSASPILAAAQARRYERGAFLSGMAISLANPWEIAFWLSLGSATALGMSNESAWSVFVFFGSFIGGTVIWAFVLSFAIGFARRWIRPVHFRLASLACGIALGAFAVSTASHVFGAISGP